MEHQAAVMNSGSKPPASSSSTEVVTLITDCLSSAKNLGTVQSFRGGKKAIEIVRISMERLSPALSKTERSVLAAAVLHYLWNSVKIHPQHAPPWSSQIIDINDYNKLSDVLMTCFVWIVSLQDGRELGQMYGFWDVDISTWEPEQMLVTTELADSVNNYFDLIRTSAINWTKEIVANFNEMVSTSAKIAELNPKRRNAHLVAKTRIPDTEADGAIKSLLRGLNRQEFTQCSETMRNLSTRLPQIWLSALAVVLLPFLRRIWASNVGQSEQLREICHTCLVWVQPIDEDLIAVEVLTNKVNPGSIIVWKEPRPSGSFSKIWHKIHTFEDMENRWDELDIEITNDRVLTHATTCRTVIQMLKDAAAAADEHRQDAIKIKGRQSTVNYTGVNLVWTAVQLTKQEIDSIPNTCRGKQHLIDSPKRYGSVCLDFPLGSVLGDKYADILSTRQYIYEYSQSIIVRSFDKLFLRQYKTRENEDETLNLGTMDMANPLLGHKWKLAFSKDSYEERSWTHPELVFMDDLSIPLDKLKISFIGHSGCVGGKKCEECGLRLDAIQARIKFEKLWEETELKEAYDIDDLIDELSLKILPRPVSASPPKMARVDNAGD